MGILEKIVVFVAQVWDFGVKAFAEYSQTAQGAKEWQDVIEAGVALGVIHENVLSDTPTPEPNGSAGVPAGDVPSWVSNPQASDASSEQASADSGTTTGRRVFVAPPAGEGS